MAANEVEPVVHVAIVRLDAMHVPEPATVWLHASEVARLEQLKATQRRRQYLAGHWLARTLLAQVYGGEDRAWQLRERRDRPPEILTPQGSATDPAGRIELSLAHSGDWLAAAVGRGRFGIDLEQRPRRMSSAALAPVLLAPDEDASAFDDDALLARWVAKEAWIKREHGSALPERLRQLRLVADTAGELRAYRSEHFHLAVATRVAVVPVSGSELLAVGAWRVEDAAG